MAYQTDEPRYINPLTDYGFKRIFGDKEVMIAFLTDLLEPKSPIKEVIFLDKELVAPNVYERGVIYDLRCLTEDGDEFIVEMQNKSQLHFSDRIIFYLSRAFSSQEERGDDKWNYKLHPVYGIFFLNFHLRGFEERSIRTIKLKVDETGEIFSEKLRAYTLELPGYTKMEPEDCKTKIDYWLYNLSNMENMTTAIPFQAQQPVFNKVGNIAELVNMSKADREKYNIDIDTYRTNLSVMMNERAEGVEEGMAKGLEKGLAQGMAQGMAKGMAKGMEKGLEKGRAERDNFWFAKLRASGLTDEQINAMVQ